ncbi:MAG: RluA family pseudouridine synthase [Patescibacteria group bacterium]|jgi:23S rRNA pseudouridine1911/1915/1917 synthase
MINISVLYEDESILIVNKPAGLVVNRAESVKEKTIQDWMESRYSVFSSNFLSPEEKEFLARSGVIHRLDKETSGVMVLAKTAKAFHGVKAQFKARETEKRYVALVHGKVIPQKGSINLPLKRNLLNRRRFTVAVDGKMAKTEYTVHQYYLGKDNEEFTFLNLKLKTGRTHQIRVHLSHLGYPLVSDPLYLGKRLQQDVTWCPRLFLHARYLSFTHPQTCKRVAFEAELSPDLSSALERLIKI